MRFINLIDQAMYLYRRNTLENILIKASLDVGFYKIFYILMPSDAFGL